MQPAVALHVDKMPQTIAAKTRRVYDHLAGVYPASTFFFHSKAHRAALQVSGLRNGMKVLEVATGSGEMFRRLADANPDGRTCGVDLSPNMAARTQRHALRKFPAARLHCQAVDARALPYKEHAFDAVFCCYLFELLAQEDIVRTLTEIRRVLLPNGVFTTILIGQNTRLFNSAYQLAGSLVPSFWGRQVADSIPGIVRALGFHVEIDQSLRQGFYPSRILTARKAGG
jgi:ubiquinone/menaquinone biosynthesis C-methylase UbiE